MGVEKVSRPVLASRGVEGVVRSTDAADGSTFSPGDGLWVVDTATTGVTFTLPIPRPGSKVTIAYAYKTTGSTMTVRANSTAHTFRPTTNNVVRVSSGTGVLEFHALTTAAWAIPSAGTVTGTVTLAAST